MAISGSSHQLTSINRIIGLSNELLGTNFSEIEVRLENNGLAEEMRKGFMEEAAELHDAAASAMDH